MDERVSHWIADRTPAYLDGRASDLEALRRALIENDLPCIEDLAHKMKGTGCSFGFLEITEIGGRMEAAAKAGNRTEINTCISALSDCLSVIKTERASAADHNGSSAQSGSLTPDQNSGGRRP